MERTVVHVDEVRSRTTYAAYVFTTSQVLQIVYKQFLKIAILRISLMAVLNMIVKLNYQLISSANGEMQDMNSWFGAVCSIQPAPNPKRRSLNSWIEFSFRLVFLQLETNKDRIKKLHRKCSKSQTLIRLWLGTCLWKKMSHEICTDSHRVDWHVCSRTKLLQPIAFTVFIDTQEKKEIICCRQRKAWQTDFRIMHSGIRTDRFSFSS